MGVPSARRGCAQCTMRRPRNEGSRPAWAGLPESRQRGVPRNLAWRAPVLHSFPFHTFGTRILPASLREAFRFHTPPAATGTLPFSVRPVRPLGTRTTIRLRKTVCKRQIEKCSILRSAVHIALLTVRCGSRTAAFDAGRRTRHGAGCLLECQLVRNRSRRFPVTRSSRAPGRPGADRDCVGRSSFVY